MAVKFWVPAASTILAQNGDSAIDGSALNKQTLVEASIDDAVRVSIAQPTSLWRLKCTAGTVGTAHGAITSVKLHARIYVSNTGPAAWDFETYGPYVAPYMKPTGSGRAWSLPLTITSDAVYRVGYILGYGTANSAYDYVHNWNQAGEPFAYHLSWTITSDGNYGYNAAFFGSNDAKLNGCEFGISVNEQDLFPIGEYPINNSKAGWMPIQGAGGSTPRWNVSQLILEVDADDPPAPPVTTRPLIMVMG